METRDLDGVARVHGRAFPDAALTALGPAILRRYYEWLLTGPHDAQCIGAHRGGDLVGYSFGGVFRGSLTGFVRGNAPRLALGLALRPRTVVSLLRRFGPGSLATLGRRALRFRMPSPGEAWPEPGPAETAAASFGILAIAVDPAAQGGGVGAALMREAEAEALRRGFVRMHLSVHPSNAGAVAFYERLGWSRLGEPWTGRMGKRIG